MEVDYDNAKEPSIERGMEVGEDPAKVSYECVRYPRYPEKKVVIDDNVFLTPHQRRNLKENCSENKEDKVVITDNVFADPHQVYSRQRGEYEMAQETNIGKEEETRTRPANVQSAPYMTKVSTEDKNVANRKRKNEESFENAEIKRSARDTSHEVKVQLSSNISEWQIKADSKAEGGDEKISKGTAEISRKTVNNKDKILMQEKTNKDNLRGETSTRNGMLGEIAYKLSFGIDKNFTIISGDWVCRVFGEMIYGEFSAEEIQRAGVVPMLLQMNNNTKNIRYKYLIQKLADKFGETIREARLAAAKSSEELKASLKRKRTFPMNEEASAAQSVDDKSAKMSESLDQKEVVSAARKRRKYVFNCEARKSFPRKEKIVKSAGSSQSEKSSKAIERTKEPPKPINHDLSFYCRGLRIGLYKDYRIWNLDWIRRMFQEIMAKEITAEEVQASQIIEILEKMINHVANKKHKELIEPVYAQVKNTLESSVESKSIVSG
ncbi:hypothetical protein ACOME3_007244 [Neoechinorhynchus agilis]